MKVLFVISAYGKPSGAEHVLLDFLRTTPEIDPIVLLIGPDRASYDEFKRITNNCIYVECQNQLNDTMSRFVTMGLRRDRTCKELRKNPRIVALKNDSSVEVVYFNNSFESASFFPLFAEKRTVVHIHDMVNMFRPAHKACVLHACRKSNQVITVSKACKEQLTENGIDNEKIVVAYNGMLYQKQDYIEQDKSLCFGFVGSVIKRKGFDVFVDIVNKIQTKVNLPIRMLVITNSDKDEQYFSECMDKVGKGIEKDVFVRIPRERVQAAYREMTALIVPSRYDPLPTVVLEATMAACPVFGTDKDGIPEMICNKDMLFSVDDSNEAVQKILNWLHKPTNAKATDMETAQEYVARTFTPENKRKTVLYSLNSLG